MWGRAFDLAVIGGGINGCGIARDAAGRGMSVFLCDEGDLAGGSTSASAKLLSGVPAALTGLGSEDDAAEQGERERLIGAAPHVARPIR
ncbi:MAG: FAD-dependent oxidoreductase, partial [Rhizobiales bacterium]|nr:FAD-dependent oxidoreductase [Hyphomicrobiales bacterium]